MKSKLVAFRCPLELLDKLDIIEEQTQSNRTAIIIEALRIFTRQVQKRGGQVVPAYTPSAIPKDLNFRKKG